MYIKSEQESKERYNVIHMLRQDLEAVKNVCDMVHQREKLKLKQIQALQRYISIIGYPLQLALNPALEGFKKWVIRVCVGVPVLINISSNRIDTKKIFAFPVDSEQVPDYYEIVKKPMDFSKIQAKIDACAYRSLKQFEASSCRSFKFGVLDVSNNRGILFP